MIEKLQRIDELASGVAARLEFETQQAAITALE